MTISKRLVSKANSKKELRELSRKTPKQPYKPKTDPIRPSATAMDQIERLEDLLFETIKSSNGIKNEITKCYQQLLRPMIPAFNHANRQKKAAANWLMIANSEIQFDEYGRIIVNLIGSLRNDPYLESLSDEHYDKAIFEKAKDRLKVSRMIIKDINGYSEYEV